MKLEELKKDWEARVNEGDEMIARLFEIEKIVRDYRQFGYEEFHDRLINALNGQR